MAVLYTPLIKRLVCVFSSGGRNASSAGWRSEDATRSFKQSFWGSGTISQDRQGKKVRKRFLYTYWRISSRRWRYAEEMCMGHGGRPGLRFIDDCRSIASALMNLNLIYC